MAVVFPWMSTYLFGEEGGLSFSSLFLSLIAITTISIHLPVVSLCDIDHIDIPACRVCSVDFCHINMPLVCLYLLR